MLATLNDKQNDPHDVIEISPDVVRASRPDKDAPTLAPDIANRPPPKIEPAIAAPSVDKAVRAALSDYQASRKRSSVGKWLRGAMLSMLFAAGSAAAAIGWELHGDTVKQMAAPWMPAFLVAATPSQAAPAVADQPASPAPQAEATEQDVPQATAPTQQADATPATAAATTTAAAPPDDAQALQSMTRDLAAMGQQIEQLKANIAELKAGQEQMAREMSKPPQAKPAETRSADPRAKLTALPPRPPAVAPRKPKPVHTPAYTPAYAPTPITPPPPPSQATAVAQPPAAAPQQTADDGGPVVRPPSPVR
jgi:hypothetical protein